MMGNTAGPVAAVKHGLRNIVRYARMVHRAYMEDETLDLGAALAFYTIFSIMPMLVVIIAVAGLLAGPSAAEGQLFTKLTEFVGEDTAKALQGLLGNAYESGQGIVATVVGTLTLVVGATGVFNALKTSLNRMWEIQPKPKSTVLGFLFGRLLSFSFVLGMGFLMVVSFLLSALVTGFAGKIAELLPGGAGVLVVAASNGVSLLMTVGVFAALFKYLPDARIAWRDVIPGAILTTLLFIVGKYALTFYFQISNPASAFGAAASLMSLLLWVYYSSQIFFLGAEFIYVWAREHGRPIRPGPAAVQVVKQEVVIDQGRVVSTTSKADEIGRI
jgi:membrane protein